MPLNQKGEPAVTDRFATIKGEIERPLNAPCWRLPEEPIALTSKPWQSAGGKTKRHPWRALPALLRIAVPPNQGELRRIGIAGIFALCSSETPGEVEARISLLKGDQTLRRIDLIAGIHTRDACDLDSWERCTGDGVRLETLGEAGCQGLESRIDMLTIELGDYERPDAIVFRAEEGSASFVIFDAFFTFEALAGCPFRATSGGVPLSEVAGIVRVCDRYRFNKAVDQLLRAICHGEDLDEARSQALTFLALVTAGALESGGPRALHRVQLDAARRLDGIDSIEGVARTAKEIIDEVATPLFAPLPDPTARLMDKALAIIERNYSKRLTDSDVAERLGLSTSHFRFLFKSATGQPFHKYLIATRLEKARKMLVQENLPISTVAKEVGFAGLAHFSRAFVERFQVRPTALRHGSLDAE